MSMHKIVDACFQEESLIRHQLDSFNKFIKYDIKRVIDDVGSITCGSGNTCIVHVTNPSLSPIIHTETDGQNNRIKPHEARLRNISYAAGLHVDLTVELEGVVTEYKMCEIGKIPIMVRSEYCSLRHCDDYHECKKDLGGYFIISGNEKVLISQEKMNNNHVYVFEKRGGKVECEGEIRSVAEGDTKTTSTIKVCIMRTTSGENKLVAQLPFLKTDVPALVMFAILGIDYKTFIQESDLGAVQDLIFYSEQDMNEELKDIDAEAYLTKKLTTPDKGLDEVLERYMLPHMLTKLNKAHMYGYIVNKVISCYVGVRPYDDRDHFKNKRIDMPGDLLTGLFRQLYKKTHKDISVSLYKMYEQTGSVSIAGVIKSKVITNGLKYALATGNWGVGSSSGIRSGVSQVLNRHSYLSTLSHLRRINSPIGKDGKLTAPRQLHGSHAFRICPCETPEGAPCGLVKNIALTCMISLGSPSMHLKNILINNGVRSLDIYKDSYKTHTKVFVNGFFLGYHDKNEHLLQTMRGMKRNSDINPETGISYDSFNNEVRFHTEGGRCCRPLLIVKDRSLIASIDDLQELTWSQMLENGIVELLDSDEEENALIAFSVRDMTDRSTLQFTHCEIHPSMMLGICASMIPYSNHNQAPRNVYQSAMCKQAMGQYTTNHNERMDSYGHVLWYPQKALVKTAANDTFGFDEMPSGVNAIVAIACYGGHNQEDSLIMNQSAIDKGMFRSYFYRTYKDETKQHGSSCKDVIEKPDNNECIGIRYANYDKLDDDGVVCPGEHLDDADIVIGKTSTVPNAAPDMKQKKDYSTMLRHNEKGEVDKVMVSTNEQGQSMVKVKVRSMRVPEIGDKFSSRHGQKGTVGITLNNEDMPFTADGIVPDVIVNPHAIPSRMTVAQLIECISGKSCSIDGEYRNATAFDHDSADDIAEQLHKLGYHRHGTEKMYSGHTGLQLEADIFIGPTYYQRLKHMVSDKVHGRAKGPVQILTRQPVEGRSRGGGLRFGEMERDVMISHGASAFLKERLMDQSDAFVMCVCKGCGFMAIDDEQRQSKYCNVCKTSEHCTDVMVPYACKLLMQELMSMNIAPKMAIE